MLADSSLSSGTVAGKGTGVAEAAVPGSAVLALGAGEGFGGACVPMAGGADATFRVVATAGCGADADAGMGAGVDTGVDTG